MIKAGSARARPSAVERGAQRVALEVD